MTCGDCVEKNQCMERSRDYCCTSFKKKVSEWQQKKTLKTK